MNELVRHVLLITMIFILSGCTLNYSITDLNSKESAANTTPTSGNAPIMSGVVTDGVYYSSLAQSSNLSWVAGSDSGSGIQKYQISIGTTVGGSQILNWTDIGNVTSYQVSGLSLTEGVTYYPSIRAIDDVGNISTAINGDGWIPDVTGPIMASVDDGDQIVSTSFSSWITWPASIDGLSGVASYEVRIVDSVNTAVTGWVDVGMMLSYRFEGLTLVEGNTYKAEVKAKDVAGNESITQGNGWYVVPQGWSHQAYLKAPNAEADDYFGYSVAISGDTVVVGAYQESSNQTVITNGTSASGDNSASSAGAAYVFKRSGTTWTQEAYLKAPNAEANDGFGVGVAISGDTVVVGAIFESSNQTVITNGTSASGDNSASSAGAVYVFKRSGTNWSQEAYLKAPNAEANDFFGASVAISGDTVVVGAYGEDSNQTIITNGTSASGDNSAVFSGAAYVFKRSGTNWSQEAYLKAPNAGVNDFFGLSVAVSGDTAVVGASFESSNQTVITNGTSASGDNSASSAGAAYVFKRSGANWSQEAYLKAPNAEANDYFGFSVAISGDTAVVGAYQESSNQTVITNGTSASGDNSASSAGAAYVFKRSGTNWSQEAYLKAPNSGLGDFFGASVAISGDTVVVGAYQEDSNQITITNGSSASSDNSASSAGAAYVFKRSGTNWSQEAYLKAPNAQANDSFGYAMAISGDTVVVGAYQEDSNQITITNGSSASSDNSASSAGAAYVFTTTAWNQQAYVKASNAEANDFFGASIDISGNTMVVGAFFEDSNETTITNGSTASTNNSAADTGAAYVYKRTGGNWAQEAFLKAPNADANDWFGSSVAISNDTIVVASPYEDSNQTIITNGSSASSDNTALGAGAVYVFRRNGVNWVQEAYLKAPNAEATDTFGGSIAISGDTVVVGAYGEDSNQTIITNGNTASSDNSAPFAGAVYVFKRTGAIWDQEAYIKASNANTGDFFGNKVAIADDTLVVGAYNEDSNQTTIINGTSASSDNSSVDAGAAYVYKRTGNTWVQEAYLKAPNSNSGDVFGSSVAISGETIVVGSSGEASNQTFITNGSTASSNNSAINAGAAYVFKRSGASWAQEAYLKPSNSGPGDRFGVTVAIAGDVIAVGAYGEASNQTTITNGSTASSNNSVSDSGAAYIFKRSGTNWSQEAYFKAPNPDNNDNFGISIAISGDTLVVGAYNEGSNQTFITNGKTASSDNSAANAGAVYVFKK